jgi:hypothetical protein
MQVFSRRLGQDWKHKVSSDSGPPTDRSGTGALQNNNMLPHIFLGTYKSNNTVNVVLHLVCKPSLRTVQVEIVVSQHGAARS